MRWIYSSFGREIDFLAVKFMKDYDMIVEIFITRERDRLFFYEVDEE